VIRRLALVATLCSAGPLCAAVLESAPAPELRPAVLAPDPVLRPADLAALAGVQPAPVPPLLRPAVPVATDGPLNLAIADLPETPVVPVVTQGPAALLAMMSPPAPSRPDGLGPLSVLSLSTSNVVPSPAQVRWSGVERRLELEPGPIPAVVVPAAAPALALAQSGFEVPLLRPEQGDGGIFLAAALAPMAPLSRPVLRGATITTLVSPPSRPGLAIAEELVAASRVAFVANPVSLSPFAVARAMMPSVRPDSWEPPVAELIPVAAAATAPRASGGGGGGLCGDSRLAGDYLGNVPGPGACGVDDAVLLRSVGGVRLSEPATVNCDTARALAAWVDRVALPALGGIEVIETMGSYSCRGRNGQSGARLSEHAFGRAFDIGGFRLTNGNRITVLNDWGGGAAGRALRDMHRGACGIFGTVLGPEANAFHRNHFHFDTASYRSGSYCE
jgi:hypothetical protein